MNQTNAHNFISLAAIAVALIAAPLVSGCSCGSPKPAGNNGGVNYAESGRTYDNNSGDLRVKSGMSDGDDGDGPMKMLGRGYKKGEKDPLIEKLEQDGKRALKNRDFVEAERLFSAGDYEGAMKMYQRASGSAGQNSYIERRAAAAANSLQRAEVRQNPEIKKASDLLTDGRGEDALSILNTLEKAQENSPERNEFLLQRINKLKMNAYRQAGDEKSLDAETAKQFKIDAAVSEKKSKTWTAPIE